MRNWWVAAGLAVCGALAAAQEPAWFTVAGDPLERTAETVQVDPDRIAGSSAEGALEMRVRVNRAAPRYNWDGIPYRSYESRVVFDCRSKSAAYVHVRYYNEPLWRGEPHHEADYTTSPRPMRFRDMAPNPTARLVRAACRRREN